VFHKIDGVAQTLSNLGFSTDANWAYYKPLQLTSEAQLGGRLSNDVNAKADLDSPY